MRELFAHDAALAIEPDADMQAPGAAVTKALCGSWEHEPHAHWRRTTAIHSAATEPWTCGSCSQPSQTRNLPSDNS